MTERIMLIDDDPDITGFVTTNLELDGFAVKSAATAAEGLAMGLADPPDLFLLDVSSGGDGDGVPFVPYLLDSSL